MEERLRKFVHVVEQGGFSKAAISLHMSQPALTTAVKKLERELDVILLERGAKQVNLTPAGEIAYRSAKELETQAFNLRQRLQLLVQARPTVRLGMIDSLADTLANETNGFAGLKQATDLSVVVDNSRQLTLSVIQESLEAAIIVDDDEALPEGLSAESLGSEPLLLVIHPTDRQHYKEALRDGRLPNFLSYNAGSHTQHLIDRALSDKHITAEPTFYSTSPEIMLKMVLLRQGAAILPFALVRRQLLERALISVSPQPAIFSRSLSAIHYQGRLLPAVLTHTFVMADAALKKLAAEAQQVVS